MYLSHDVPDKTVSNNATVDEAKNMIKDLYTKRDCGYSCISLTNESELNLDIYKSAIILTDFGGFSYGGPGGKGELLNIRVEEWGILGIFEKAFELLKEYETEKLIDLLKSLPKEKK